jgi:hypothetical protein
LPNFGVLDFILRFLFDFKLFFNGFCPKLGDLDPDLRPDLGRMLPTSILYKPKVLGSLRKFITREIL